RTTPETLRGTRYGGFAPAQPPGPPPGAGPQPAAAPADPKLDAHLKGWEDRMTGLTNFHAKFGLTRTDAVFKKDRKYDGSVLVMKPSFARIRMDNVNKRPGEDDYEAFICDGKAVYFYSGLEKTITEYPFQANGGGGLMLDLVRGMTAQQAKQRFQISLFKEDPNYVYLDIKPVLGADQQEFLHVRFALFGPGVKPPHVPYMPAQAWTMKPNQDTELWDFRDVQVNIQGLDAKPFQFQPIPGWPVKKAPPAGGPMPGPGGPVPGKM
ncbi:MAG: TIGR03009 domain-containing protein, partial [Gemmataceae bacterium]|nr:TIGR03009 domain-containing protein [Gemmataceae bacterium]